MFSREPKSFDLDLELLRIFDAARAGGLSSQSLFRHAPTAERSAMQRVAPGAGTFLGRRGRRNYFQAGAGICLQTARLPRPTEGVFWSKKAQNTASRCISDTSMTRRKCLLEYGTIVSRVTEYITDSTQNDRSEIRQRPTHKE
jgi:hypothetical protein